MLNISFALSNDSGNTLVSGSEALTTEEEVERFISHTMPGWALALRNTFTAAKAVSLTTETPEPALPDATVAKMLS